MGRVALALVVATVVLVGTTASAQEPARPPAVEPSAIEIGRRIDALAARRGVQQVAGDTLGQARRALARAAELEAAGRTVEAQRASQIAWAALLLASRQWAWSEERGALRAARRRVSAAQRAAEAEREALLHAAAERAQLRREASP